MLLTSNGEFTGAKKKKLYSYLSISLAIYIFLLFVVGRFLIFQPVVIWVFGPLFAVIVVLNYIGKSFPFPREVIAFCLFWLWTITGYTSAYNLSGYFRYFRLIFTILVLFFCIEVVLIRTGDIAMVFKTFIWVAVINFGYSLVLGNITSDIQQEEYRLSSLITNPNGNAYIAISGMMGILFLWTEVKFKLSRYVYIFLLISFFTAVVLTASRSGFITTCIMLIFWFIFCYKEQFKKHFIVYILAIIVLLPVFMQVFEIIAAESYLGERFRGSAQEGDLLDNEKRVSIYAEAFNIFLSHPITGVGLAQYQNYTRFLGVGQTHSEYMELLSTTGGIGFLLIMFIYIYLWRTINKLKRAFNSELIIYRLNFLKVVLLAVIVFGIFRPNFLDIYTMIQVAAVAGYTGYLKYYYVKAKKVVYRIIEDERKKILSPVSPAI